MAIFRMSVFITMLAELAQIYPGALDLTIIPL
jgi:hypothetical protein